MIGKPWTGTSQYKILLLCYWPDGDFVYLFLFESINFFTVPICYNSCIWKLIYLCCLWINNHFCTISLFTDFTLGNEGFLELLCGLPLFFLKEFLSKYFFELLYDTWKAPSKALASLKASLCSRACNLFVNLTINRVIKSWDSLIAKILASNLLGTKIIFSTTLLSGKGSPSNLDLQPL